MEDSKLFSGRYQAVEMMQWTGADRELAHLLALARHFQITSIEIEVFCVQYLEHALSDLTRVVQGSDLEQRPLAFEQVLKFIRTMRSTHRRPVTFIGITRTGLTSNMVRQIGRTIALLPTKTIGPVPVLEMQKVFERAL
jgi:hypothetical protein